MGTADHLAPEELLADTRWLRALARGLAGESEADDLAQETWLRVFARPPRFLTNLRPWLRTVARNLSLRDRDKRVRREKREERVARPEGEPSAADLVARATLRRSVVDAVLELAEPYRSTILLRFFEDLRPREIARRQQIPVATVRTRIRRGLDQLKARLGDQHGSQASWLLLLVPARDLLAGSWLTGALVMGTKAKIAAAAAVLIVAGLGVWRWSPWRNEAAQGRGPESAATLASPLAPPDSKPATAPVANMDSTMRPAKPLPAHDEIANAVSITGTVIDDRTDRGVSGVVVRAMMWSGKQDPNAAEVSTAAEGRFRLLLPHKGRTRGLILMASEYAPLVLDPISQQLFSFSGNVYDVGTLRLRRGARISGRVVSETTGDPVPGAGLYSAALGYRGTWQILSEPRPVGRSERDGSFVLSERVPPNETEEAVILAVTETGIGWTCAAIVKDREDLGGVEIAVGRTAAVRVSVTDDEGKPIEGVAVTAVPRFPPLGPPEFWGNQSVPDFLHPEIGRHFTCKSGSDGVAALTFLPIGRPDLRFESHPASPFGYDVSAWHQAYAQKAPVRVQLDPAKEVEVRIQLFRRKTFAIRGRVKSEDGTPIAGARVMRAQEPGSAVVTDCEGLYRLAPVDAPGGASVGAQAAGFVTQYREMRLAGSEDEVVADFVLLRASVIAGRVVDQDGHPVPGAHVDISDERHHFHRATVPADGCFAFPEATAGSWFLRVSPPEPMGDWAPPLDHDVHGGDQNLELVLRRRVPGRARLEAEIVDAISGAPLDPAEARIECGTPSFPGGSLYWTPMKTAIGSVTAEKIWPGSWQLFVRLSNGSRATKAFTVGPDDTIVRVRMEIGKPGILIARVDSSGLAAGAVLPRVAILTSPPHAAQWMTRPGVAAPNCTRGYGSADASNEWTVRFEDVTPNLPIRLWTSGGDVCFGETEVTVGFGEEKEIVLKLAPGAMVTFRKPDPAAVAGVVIFFRRPDGTWARAWSDSWDPGRPWKRELKVVAGHVPWRAERYALDTDPELRRVEATVEGELDLRAGETREVPIVFPH